MLIIVDADCRLQITGRTVLWQFAFFQDAHGYVLNYEGLSPDTDEQVL